MNTRVRTAEHAMKAAPKHDKMKDKNSEVVNTSKLTDSGNRPRRCMSRRERKIALLQDVDKLRKKLRHEENVHRALERAFTRPLGALPRLPPYLPTYTLELLAEVAVLEEEVVRLEEQVVNFRQGLYREAIYISSSKRTMENGVDSCSDRFSFQNAKNTEQHNSHNQLSTSDGSAISSSFPSMRWSPDGNHYISSSHRLVNIKRFPKKLNFSCAEGQCENESHSNANTTKNVKQTLVRTVSVSRMLASQIENQATEKERVGSCIRDGSNEKAFEEASGANKLSEEILRCLMSIFARISFPKSVAVETEIFPSVSGSCGSSEDVGFRDPYDICTEFGRREIGPYKHLCEVNMSSFNVNLISKCSFLTRRLKLLLRKLASVSISELSHQQKLAFWINVYNSCMMNAFLENGIPTAPEMIVALMPKAMVNVGGQMFSAMTIEHFILRLPYQSKHVSLKGLKTDEMTRRSLFGLDWPEPLVTFALSCGSWSSPAVRVYTASQVEQQLQEAKRDYLQAAVGVSKPNRFAIPKLLDWYLLDFAKDIESLMDWICLQMPSDLRNDAVACLEMSKRSVIPLPIQVLPYEFRFRYLMAP